MTYAGSFRDTQTNTGRIRLGAPLINTCIHAFALKTGGVLCSAKAMDVHVDVLRYRGFSL